MDELRSERNIEQEIQIHAPSALVWRVFTDPVLTRLLGGEYVCAWNIGEPFGWKSIAGNMLTRGTLLQFIPGQLLQHDLFSKENKPIVLSVITYTLTQDKNTTTLHAREEMKYDMTEEEYRDSIEGWQAALMAIKQVVEEIAPDP